MGPIHRPGNRSRRCAALVVAAAASAPSLLFAQTVATWTAGTGNFVDGVNWSTGVAPTVAGDVFAAINNGGTAVVGTGHSGEAADLVLGLEPTQSGNLSMSDGTLTLGDLHVGGRATLFDNATPNGGGAGVFTQSGGTVNVNAMGAPSAIPKQWLYIGHGGLASGNTATGSYVLSGGQVNVGTATSGRIIVGAGAGAVGSFAQSGTSSVILDGDSVSGSGIGTMEVGTSGGSGSYSIANTASLTITNGLNVGAGTGSSGAFNQSGGTVTDKTDMNVGLGGGTGSYTLSAGTLAVGAVATHVLAIGNGAGSLGTFTQHPGSTLNITGRLSVGRSQSVADNHYHMIGGTLTTSTEINVGGNGTATASRGTFTQTAGDVTVNTNLVVGFAAGGVGNTGTYNLDGGTLTFPRAAAQAIVAIGNGAGGVGTFVQTGGTLTNTAKSDAIIDVGRGGAATGSYTMTGGVMNTKFFRLTANAANRADFTGGTSTTETLRVNGGIFTVSGGNHSFTGVSTIDGTSNMTVTGAGSVTFAGAVNMGGTGTLHLAGGTTSFAPTATLSIGGTSTLRTSVPFTVPVPVTMGSAFVDVQSGTLTFAAGLTSAAVRNLTKTGNGTLVIAGPQNHVGGSALTNNGGTLNLDNAGHANLTVNANAGVTNFLSAGATFAALNVAGGATAAIPANGSRVLTVAAVSPGGVLDVADNTFNLSQTGVGALDTVRGYLASGFNGGGWNGSAGILSSSAQAAPGHGLWYRDTGAAIEVKYAWFGDVNFDGKVDPDDYAVVDRNYALGTFAAGSAGHWSDGDFNYDGVLTSADYFLMDTGFGKQNGMLSPDLLSARGAQFGPEYVQALVAAVPEPTTLGAAGIAAASLLTRRRRR